MSRGSLNTSAQSWFKGNDYARLFSLDEYNRIAENISNIRNVAVISASETTRGKVIKHLKKQEVKFEGNYSHIKLGTVKDFKFIQLYHNEHGHDYLFNILVDGAVELADGVLFCMDINDEPGFKYRIMLKNLFDLGIKSTLVIYCGGNKFLVGANYQQSVNLNYDLDSDCSDSKNYDVPHFGTTSRILTEENPSWAAKDGILNLNNNNTSAKAARLSDWFYTLLTQHFFNDPPPEQFDRLDIFSAIAHTLPSPIVSQNRRAGELTSDKFAQLAIKNINTATQNKSLSLMETFGKVELEPSHRALYCRMFVGETKSGPDRFKIMIPSGNGVKIVRNAIAGQIVLISCSDRQFMEQDFGTVAAGFSKYAFLKIPKALIPNYSNELAYYILKPRDMRKSLFKDALKACKEHEHIRVGQERNLTAVYGPMVDQLNLVVDKIAAENDVVCIPFSRYRERISANTGEFSAFSPNGVFKITVTAEPNEMLFSDNRNILYWMKTENNVLVKGDDISHKDLAKFKTALVTSFSNLMYFGPILNEQMSSIRIRIAKFEILKNDTSEIASNEITTAMRFAMINAIKSASPLMLQPYYKVKVVCLRATADRARQLAIKENTCITKDIDPSKTQKYAIFEGMIPVRFALNLLEKFEQLLYHEAMICFEKGGIEWLYLPGYIDQPHSEATEVVRQERVRKKLPPLIFKRKNFYNNK